jgi:hypothetical protein
VSFNLSVRLRPAWPSFLRREETFSVSRHRIGSSSSNERISPSNVVSAETLFVSRSTFTGRSSSPQAMRESRWASRPRAATRVLWVMARR